MRTRTTLFAAAAAALLAVPASAQSLQLAATSERAATRTDSLPAAAAETEEAPRAASRGFNAFEGEKFDAPFEGVRISVGGAFAMNFQALRHSNAAAPRLDAAGTNLNQLAALRPGLNLPTANLNLHVQLAPGINMVLESYMSSRHHNEFWVKGGYATIDQSPINVPALNQLFQYVTVRAGMYEPFYGDALYRRSDNGNVIDNPFAENLILDAFTTEPGMDVTVRMGSAFAMLGATTGQNKGDVLERPVSAKPALLAKAGYDRQVSDLLRVRLSGSLYHASETPGATLYAGDRTGSNYWGIVDNAAGASFTNGRLSARFPNEMTAVQVNPFVKLGGLELFGVLERAEGKALTEATRREVTQYAADAVYRFLGDRLYVAGRYNTVQGDPTPGPADNDITIDRQVVSGGWFISPNILTKVEYVTQKYDGFASTDILHGAKFNGFVVQAAISF
jgi:hypothetical protein